MIKPFFFKPVMNRLAYLFFAFILIACSNNRPENKTIIDGTHQGSYTIDTVLDGYDTKIILSDRYLKKGSNNEMKIGIKDVPNEKILIYTKTSEATVKLIKDTTGFLILPKKTADSVSIYININKEGKTIPLGKIKIKTE